MFSANSYLNHSKNNQMVRAVKGDSVRSQNWYTLKLIAFGTGRDFHGGAVLSDIVRGMRSTFINMD